MVKEKTISGLVDAHVHFRDPGQTSKESIARGSLLARSAGFSAVVMMPNTSPVIDDHLKLLEQNKTICEAINNHNEDLKDMQILQTCAITKNIEGKELVDFEKVLKVKGTHTYNNIGRSVVAFTDDGKSPKDKILYEAVKACAHIDVPIMDHVETKEDVIRDIEFSQLTGCHIHLQHIAYKSQIELIKKAKAKGINITCETCPHYFALNKKDIKVLGAYGKVNPPLGTETDNLAIINAIKDGIIDMISSDYAPHTIYEKTQTFDDAPFGIAALYDSFNISYNILVKGGHISFQELEKLMALNPAKIFGIKINKKYKATFPKVEYVNYNTPIQLNSKSINNPYRILKCKTNVVLKNTLTKPVHEIIENSFTELQKKIDEKNAPVCIGLDPTIELLPYKLKKEIQDGYEFDNTKIISELFFEFNKKIIDACHDIVPAVKPQIAFYEKYGHDGLDAYIKTCRYAKHKDLIVIGDIKRGDIGSTVTAYRGHLENPYWCEDIITVNPYLGSDGIDPLIEKTAKCIFILLKTSNASSKEIQELKTSDGKPIYKKMAELILKQYSNNDDLNYFSKVGGVVGLTYPKIAKELRKMLPNTFFLVPGYGAQGGQGTDTCNYFNDRGGAIISSSRGIIGAHKTDRGTKDFGIASRKATIKMINDITSAIQKGEKKK